MAFADGLSFAASSIVSWILVLAALVVFLYLARDPAHRAILVLARGLHQGLRFSAAAVLRAQTRLSARNREVLLAAGREAGERLIEREFQRVEATVRRDLSRCPNLNRQISEAVARIEEDHHASTERPPDPPGWVEAVEAVAKIPTKGDPMVVQILESIHGSLVNAQDKAIADYRSAVAERHRRLEALRPEWRKLQSLLSAVEQKVTSVLRRAEVIDRQLSEYEEILSGSDAALRRLSSSSLVQFFVSAFVLAIAVGGAAINFHLIARPMAEMVGGNNLLGGFRTADIAALVIILVEISMGLFLMESLRITRLFPVIGALPDKLRVRMVWVTFVILFLLASVEAGLAYMREILLQDELATSAILRGEAAFAFESEFVWITTAAQMGMGFVLPFALIFVAIPLETFVHSLRTVLGLAAIALLRGLAGFLHLLGNISRLAGDFTTQLYDIVIFAPLWLETQVRRNGLARKPAVEARTAKEIPS